MSALTGGKKKHTQVVDMEINEYSDEGSAFVIDRMNLVDLEWHSEPSTRRRATTLKHIYT